MKIIFLKKIFKKFFEIIRESLPIREFNNYSEAFEFCKAKSNSNYNSELLSRYRFENFNHVINNDLNLFSLKSAPFLLYTIGLFLKENNGKTPKLIDFGGACGESLFLLKNIFGDEIKNNLFIVETTSHIKESNNWEWAKDLKFSDDLLSCVENNEIDIFFSSGTIQYLPKPYEILDLVAKQSIKYISLTRNNFSLNPSIMAQRSLLSSNTFNPNISSFGNPEIWYPNTSISKNKLIDIFSKNNYVKIIETNNSASGMYGTDNYSRDLLFKIKTLSS